MSENHNASTSTTQASSSQLVIIDVQTKLCRVMQTADMQAVTQNCSRLVQAANLLQIPVISTEQYPQALGETIPDIVDHLLATKPIAKTAFSAYAEAKFKARLQRDKPQIILAGLEAHICVLQTALDLIAQGKQVFVVADAVISRQSVNKANAIARLVSAGCIVTNTESVVFEWVGNAKHAAFKAVSQLIK